MALASKSKEGRVMAGSVVWPGEWILVSPCKMHVQGVAD